MSNLTYSHLGTLGDGALSETDYLRSRISKFILSSFHFSAPPQQGRAEKSKANLGHVMPGNRVGEVFLGQSLAIDLASEDTDTPSFLLDGRCRFWKEG